MTHNISKDFLTSNRRSIDTISSTSTSTPTPTPISSNKINMNETIVVDSKLPCMNTSYIVPLKSNEMQQKPNDVQNEASKESVMTPEYDPFKMPAVPSTASNPFNSKQNAHAFDISDDEFQTPGCKSLFCFYNLQLLFIEFFVFFVPLILSIYVYADNQ